MSFNPFNRFNIKGQKAEPQRQKKVGNFLNFPILWNIVSFSRDPTLRMVSRDWNEMFRQQNVIQKWNSERVKTFHVISDLPKEIQSLPFITHDKEKDLLINYSFDRIQLVCWRVYCSSQKICLSDEIKKWKSKIIIFLCHGGDFAGCIYQDGEPFLHKTFSKYITRKKQGKRQSNKDKESHPRSAGAFLRRRNEDIFNEQVVEFVDGWKDHYEDAHLIILHTPGHNRDLFKLVCDGYPNKLRSVPFQTLTPNFTQVESVWQKLNICEIKMK